MFFGGAGDDFLAGSDGRDLLIGGIGTDRMVGNADDDILIAGTTDFDARDAALALIMQEWTRTRRGLRYPSQPSGDGRRRERGNLLTDATVHDDRAEDTFTGSSGNDWFLFNRDGDGRRQGQGDRYVHVESHYAKDIDWLN